MPSVFVLAGEENGPKKRKRRRTRRAACRVTFKKGKHGWDALLWHGPRTINKISFPKEHRLTKAEREFHKRELIKFCPTAKKARRTRRRKTK